MTSLLTAFVLREAEPVRAADALAEAKLRLGPDHPLHFMLPRCDDWEARARPEALREVLPGKVWRVEAFTPWPGTALQVGSMGTLVRSERGQLVFINPVELSPENLVSVKNLGPLAALVVQGRAHSHFVPIVRAQFPEARIVLSEGHRRHPASAHLVADGTLATDSARLPDEFLELPVLGTDADEVVIYHRPTRLLIVQDLVSNNLASHRTRSFVGRLEYFVFGLIDRIGLLSYHPILWRDLAAFQRSLAVIADLECAFVAGAHWPRELAEGSSLTAFRNTLNFVRGLSTPQHVALMARFFASQPGFLRDLALYRRKAAR
jgi:hypothetical protein